MKEMDVTRPAIGYDQNGAWMTETDSTFYDAYGRPIWTKDAGQHVTHTEYDTASGGVVDQITDVDYSLLSGSQQTSFDATAWSQPGGGLHLERTSVVDRLGRATQMDGAMDTSFGDTSFGATGRVSTDFAGDSSGADDQARAVAIQKDGKIVVAGYAHVTSNDYDYAVARYNANGSLDTSFGSGGKVTVDFAPGSHVADRAYALAIRPDGSIVVAGQSGNDVGVILLSSSGVIDTLFDGDGKAAVNFGGTDDARAVRLQSDGKIVVGGYSDDGTHVKFAAARLNADGSLDTTFDSDGKATLYDAVNGLDDEGYAMDLQADGKIIVGGQSNGDLALGRFNTDGSADTTFDSDGIVTADLGGTEEIRGLVTQSDGTIVAGGVQGTDFVIAKFTSDGALDTTFGASGGYTSTDFSMATDAAYSLARQADGKFVAAGISGGNFALARFTSDGQLDTTFDSDGKLTADFGSAVDTVYALAIGPDYKITAAGGTGSAPDGNFAVARIKVTSGLEERLYAETDANHNVTSISDVFGAVKERFAYDPYGSVTVLSSAFTTSTDTKAWKYLHQGGRYDSVAGLYSFRFRDYSPTLGRWVEQDPIGYVDGANVYEFQNSSSTDRVDPTGLKTRQSGRTWQSPPVYSPGPIFNAVPPDPTSNNPHAALDRLTWGINPSPGVARYQFSYAVYNCSDNEPYKGGVGQVGQPLFPDARAAPGETPGASEHYLWFGPTMMGKDNDVFAFLNAGVGMTGEGLNSANRPRWQNENTCGGNWGWFDGLIEIRREQLFELPLLSLLRAGYNITSVTNANQIADSLTTTPQSSSTGWNKRSQIEYYWIRGDWSGCGSHRTITYSWYHERNGMPVSNGTRTELLSGQKWGTQGPGDFPVQRGFSVQSA